MNTNISFRIFLFSSLIILNAISSYKVFAQATCKGVQYVQTGQGTIYLEPTAGWGGFVLNASDFNGDTLADLVKVVGNYSTGNQDLLILKNISTSLAAKDIIFDTALKVFSDYASYLDFVINDFNQDGKPDFAISNTDSVWVLLNMSVKDTFKFKVYPPIKLPIKGLYPTLRTSDYNKDGIEDLSYEGTDNKLYIIRVLKDTNKIGYKDTVEYSGIEFSVGNNTNNNGGSPYTTYDIADLNNDSLPDIAYVSPYSDSIFIYQNISTIDSIKFTLAQIYIGSDSMITSQWWNGHHLQIKDIDNDGKPEIAILYAPKPNLTSNYSSKQKILFLKNTTTGKTISVAYNDTIELNHYIDSIYGYKVNGNGDDMSLDPLIVFTGFAFVGYSRSNTRPDIVLTTEGSSQTYSVNSYLVNTSDSGKIKFTAPCWFKLAAADWVIAKDINNDGKDEIISYCDVCIPGSPNFGITVFTNASKSNSLDEILPKTQPSYSIIPNPTNNKIYITSNQFFTTVDIIDALGNVVKSINTTETRNLDVSLNGLSVGLYYFRIQGANDVAVKKAIKID